MLHVAIGCKAHVTPYAGVWIEIPKLVYYQLLNKVTPYAGVWIEIDKKGLQVTIAGVTPYAGVWIEIDIVNNKDNAIPSLPTRECGLKYSRICHWMRGQNVTPYAGVWIEIKYSI